jgi:heavy metal efflux system protein
VPLKKSLGGLAIAIGLLVDAAVVVVENIEARAPQLVREGHGRLHVIFRASQEVAIPVASGIAIIIIVFLPLLSLHGLEGKLFAPVALTIVFALASSLILSLVVIPVLSSFLLGGAHHEPPRFVRSLEARYGRTLEWILAHERLVFGAALGSLVAAALLFSFIGKSFLPTMDEGDLVVQLEKIPSINLQRSSEIDRDIQRSILQRVPEVQKIVSRVGTDELGLDPMGVNETDKFIVLKPREEWRVPDKEWLVDEIRRVGDDYAGVNFSFTQPIEMRVSELISGVRGDLAVKIFGPDLAQLDALALQIATALRQIEGSEDVVAVANQGLQYLQVDINRAAAGRAGLSVEALQNDLRTLVEGRTVGVVLEEGRRLPLLVRGEDSLQLSPELFQQLRLPLPGGAAMPLADLAQLVVSEGPLKVDRENSSRMAVVRSNVRGRDLVGFVAEAQRVITESVPLPEGYYLTWGGQFENQQRTSARLAVVVPVALGLIYLILFTTLGSLRQASLVFANIPFAMVGGVFALAITGEYLSVPASVGFIALMGIAVLNGLVMISYFNQLSARTADPREVILAGSRRRLRPVLMTATIAAFGLVPLLFATGPGSEIQRPLAIVVIGGLVSSTLLTLALLPSLFHRFVLRRAA